MYFNISRYKNIEELSYQCEVITPMFVSGADQRVAELREPTIKGLLRFWWRATVEFESLGEMKKNEESLFGSTDSKSMINLKLLNKKINLETKLPRGLEYKARGKSADIMDYIAYGQKMKIEGQKVVRRYIAPGSTFTIRLTFPSNNRNEIQNALFAFSMFGGIGSKSRNGFGCFKILDERIGIEKKILDHDINEFIRINRKRWEYKTESYDNWVKPLSIIGLKYRNAKRGLSSEEKAKIAKPIKGFKDRQAKPFFLHVSKTSDGKYKGKINFFPTKSMMDPKNSEEYDRVFRVFIDSIQKSGEME